jgi:hypothetical protein
LWMQFVEHLLTTQSTTIDRTIFTHFRDFGLTKSSHSTRITLNRRPLFAFKRTCDSRRRVSAGLTNRLNPPEPSNAGRAPLVKRAQHLPHSNPIPLTPVIPAVRSTVHFCFRSLPPRHYVSVTCAPRRPKGDTACHPKHILRIQPLLPEPVTTRIRV